MALTEVLDVCKRLSYPKMAGVEHVERFLSRDLVTHVRRVRRGVSLRQLMVTR